MNLGMFAVSWPTGEFGGMGLEGQVKLGRRRELAAIEDPAERLSTYEKMVADLYEKGKALNTGSLFGVDEVIDPAETRRWLVAGLRSLPPSPPREEQAPGLRRRLVRRSPRGLADTSGQLQVADRRRAFRGKDGRAGSSASRKSLCMPRRARHDSTAEERANLAPAQRPQEQSCEETRRGNHHDRISTSARPSRRRQCLWPSSAPSPMRSGPKSVPGKPMGEVAAPVLASDPRSRNRSLICRARVKNSWRGPRTLPRRQGRAGLRFYPRCMHRGTARCCTARSRSAASAAATTVGCMT